MAPVIFTIFGASGDLTFRKLIPALYTLFSKGLLHPDFVVIGFARRPWDDQEFQDYLDNIVDKKNYDITLWQTFLTHLRYLSSSFDTQEGYTALAEKIKAIEQEKAGYRSFIKVFYLSTAPEYFKVIAEQIAQSSLCEICSQRDDSRVVVEKPYGLNLEDTIETDTLLKKAFSTEHIYRIDHYIGKETVQNILVFRFANSIFERLWNSEHIDHIQIKVDESVGVEERGGYYDQTGAIRDMIQNHILQLLSVMTMEAPNSTSAIDIQQKRLEVLQNVGLWDDTSLVKGQYQLYRSEKNVNPESVTDTFVAAKLKIRLPKWESVPIYVRTGKKMSKKMSEVIVKFKDRNTNIYDKLSGSQNDILVFRIQPDEGISVMIMIKEPGERVKLSQVSLDFCYRPTFNQPILDAYVGLIQNIIYGDQSLFPSIEEIQAQWKFISNLPVSDISMYENGALCPQDADALLTRDGREWIYNENYVCALR